MPAFNAEKYIRFAMDSVLRQSFVHWELLIVDDGSTDNTASIIKKYESKDKRIRYFYQRNAKQAQARNVAIVNSNGNYLAFLDADDMWHADKLKISIKQFENSNCDLVFTDSYIIDENNVESGKMGIVENVFQGESALKTFLVKNQIPILTVVVKKQLVLTAGCFDSNCVPAEDYDLWLRLLQNGCLFKAISEPLSFYRVHNQSTTFSDVFATEVAIKCILKNFTKKELEHLNVKPQLKTWIQRWLKNCSTPKNHSQLKYILKQTNYFNIVSISAFLVKPLISDQIFRKIIFKAIT